MPSRHLAVRASLALLAPLVLLVVPHPAGASDDTAAPEVPPSTSLRVLPHQRVRLEALPQLVQPGRAVADAGFARSAFVATARPARPGRRVQLQVLRDGVWSVVATRRQDRQGRVELSATVPVGGDPATYRARVMATRGLRAFSGLPVSTARWQRPTWGDEFGGTSLGPYWNHRGEELVSASRRSCSKGDPSAVRVGGGTVRLSVVLDPDATSRCRIRGRDATRGSYAYRLNGHVGTQGRFSFRYGFAAARVRFQRMRGQHGAFWLQPVGGMYPGAPGSEIDVVEYFGDHHPQGGLATFMHRYDGLRRVSTGGWVRDQASYLRGRGDGWSRGFHVFSVEWTPRRVVFRIDGRETGRMSGRVSAERQFPILSLIAADYEIPKIRERNLPQHMDVDWVRVWETEPEPEPEPEPALSPAP